MPASIALFVATCLFQIPFLERGASLYDEGSILAIGDLLAHGGALYRDVKTFVSPLTYELLGVLYRLFGASMVVSRLFFLFAFSLVVVLAHRLFLKVVSPRAAMLGAMALWPIKPLAFPLWTVVNYSQVALLFLVATMVAAANWFESRRIAWLIATGFLAGMTLLAKQDFAAHVTFALAVAVTFDWWIRVPRSVTTYLGNVSCLAVSAAVPVILMLSYYASEGLAGEVASRTVFGPMLVPGRYDVSFPGLAPWSAAPEQLPLIVFTYFPVVFIEMAWGGGLDVFDRSQLLPLELAVKISYYLPVVAIAVVALMALSRRNRPAERSIFMMVATAPAIAYLLVYRADWSHLMNLFTPALLPVVVVCGRFAGSGRWWRSVLPGVLLVAWFAFGSVATDGILERFDTPVDSARGRIVTVPRQAADMKAVLDYVEAQPDSSTIVFLPYNPLFYFLTGRLIATPNDLVMPALVEGEQDDRELAEAVAAADVVIYNPKIYPTVYSPLYQYAPQTATVLSSLFDREQELASDAVALRKARERAPRIVADLWSDSEAAPAEPLRDLVFWGDEGVVGLPPAFRDHWMVYRVVAVQVGQPNQRRCIERRHCVRPDEKVTGMPISHPEGWAQGKGTPIRFDILVSTDDGSTRTLRSVVRSSSEAPSRVFADLGAFAGQCLTLSFCATPLAPNLPRGVAGWAEPQIVEGPSSGGDPIAGG